MSRFILLGHPLGHSLSPAIHHAAYECLGQNHEYQLVDAPDEDAVREQVERVRRGDVVGSNVTVPYKRLALALADRRDVSAERVGAANVLARNAQGEVVAYNTDALGLAGVLKELSPTPVKAVVLGNGGAALGSVVACQYLGVPDVLVSARAFRETVAPDAWPHAAEFRRLGARLIPWLGESRRARAEVATCPLIVQATSAGMKGTSGGDALADALPWDDLAADTVIYDLVYNPAETPVLARARARGLVTEGGLSMLVAQAQLAIEIWLGELPPREPLMHAARKGLEAFQ